MISRPAGHPSQVKQISTPRLSQMGPFKTKKDYRFQVPTGPTSPSSSGSWYSLYLFSLPKILNFTRLRAPLTPSIRPALVETHFSDGTCYFHDLCAFSEILEAPSEISCWIDSRTRGRRSNCCPHAGDLLALLFDCQMLS